MPVENQIAAVAPEIIGQKIYFIRGQKVMLDSDLSDLYQVPTKSLNLAVRRNKDRFPVDFVFQLTETEAQALRFQIETSKRRRGGRRYLPYAFTEHGIAMLSSVLRSKRAVQMNIIIVRTFIKLRQILETHKDLVRVIEDIRRKQEEHGERITAIIETINQILAPEPVPVKRRIGFQSGAEPGARE